MVDIGDKDVVRRTATASGRLFLKAATLKAICKMEIRKGDPFLAAEISVLQAVKKTPELLAHCHNIPIDSVDSGFEKMDDHVFATVTVKAEAKTGVEMEALMGVTIGLNTIWDMVKYLEKDKDGQYKTTKIGDIKIIRKTKGEE